jgi:hypothetical protein
MQKAQHTEQRMTPEKGNFRVRHRRLRRLIGLSRYSILNIKTEQLVRTARVDMRHCTFPAMSHVL